MDAVTAGLVLAACSNATGPGIRVSRITISPDTVRLVAPDSLQVTASPLDRQGHLISGVSIIFASPDSVVATISPLGVLNAVGFGTTSITVSGGGATAHLPVFVGTKTLLGSRPFGAAVSPKGVVYVTQLDNAQVARADLPGHTFSTSVNVGSVPTSVTFDSAGSTAYVTNQADHNVGVIDVASNTETSTLTPPGNGNTAVVRSAPHGKLLWVTTTADSIFGVNETTRAIVYRFGTGGWGNGIAFTPANDSLVYVGVQSGTVEEINFKAGTVPRTFAVGGQPQGVAVSPDGTELYIADEVSDSVHIWSLVSGTAVGNIALDGTAFDLELSPDGTQLWVGVIGAGEVQVVNRVARTIARTYAVGGVVRRIALTKDGATAIVANEGGWVHCLW